MAPVLAGTGATARVVNVAGHDHIRLPAHRGRRLQRILGIRRGRIQVVKGIGGPDRCHLDEARQAFQKRPPASRVPACLNGSR